MQLFLNAIDGILTLLIFMAVGILMYKLKWINTGTEDFLTKLTLRVAVPATLFKNALDNISLEFFRESGLRLLVPCGAILLSYLAAMGTARIFRVDKRRRGLFYAAFSLSNTIFIGLPVCLTIFGDGAAPYVTMYYLSNTVLFWSIGVSGIARDGGEKSGSALSVLKKLITSPPIIGFLIGAAIKLIGITLPGFAVSAVKGVAAMNTPLCMFILGAIIGRLGILSSFKLPKDGWLMLAGRFIVSPAITVGLCLLCGVSGLGGSVFTSEAAMPLMSQSLIVARSYGADYELNAKALSASVMLMILLIPLLTIVCGAVFGVS